MNADPTARESLMDPQHTTLKVVMVDDEEALCLGVRRIIQKYKVHVADVLVDADYEFRYFTTGEAYLAWLADGGEVDLLLLDLKLPGVGGMDVLDAMSEQGRAVLTIMITAYATFETAVKATKLGAYDFLAKPFTPEELRTVISKTTRHLLLTRETRRLAQEKRQVRFQLLSVIVHELKAPLGAIQGYLNILKDRTAGDNPVVYARAIDRSLVRIDGMRKLIMDLLDLTRLESGQKKRECASLDLRDVARSAMESVLSEAQSRRIGVELVADGPVPMLADRSEMEIVFNNLLTNAVKYNLDGGRVTVRLAADAGRVTIEVTDTGIGLTAQERDRLFREFVRIKNEKTRHVQGSGLGLSVLRRIAHLNGGEVTVRSVPGDGSTFTVEMAAAPTAATTVAAGAGAA